MVQIEFIIMAILLSFLASTRGSCIIQENMSVNIYHLNSLLLCRETGVYRHIYFFLFLIQTTASVRGSTNGKMCKFTNGIIGNFFTNGNRKTLNVFQLPMLPLVTMLPLLDPIMVEII